MKIIYPILIFLFIVTQSFAQSCSGTTTTTAFSGTFEDGSGSSNYTNNLNCTWIIQPAGANYVGITFFSFDTELNYDFVTVYEGNTGTVLGAFSGHQNISTVYSQNSSVVLSFTADNTITAAGWNVSYSGFYGSPPTCYGRKFVNTSSGVIADGSGNGDYSNDLVCEWLIQPTGASSINFQILSFSTESGPDTLVFYDGPTNNSAVLGSYSGIPATPINFASSSGTVLVIFRSDYSVASSGWSFSYNGSSSLPSPSVTPGLSPSTSPSRTPSASPSPTTYASPSPSASPENSITCSGLTVWNSSSGYIDDGSYSSNYGNNLNCQWLIQPPGALMINFELLSFASQINADYLTFYDGPNTSSPILSGPYSGNVSPITFAAIGPVLAVFSTDSSITYSGWYLYYQAMFPSFPSESPTPTPPVVNTGSCYGTIYLNTYSATISDGSGSFNYTNSLYCQWLIQNDAFYIQIEIVSLETESGLDVLTFYDGSSNNSAILGTYSGTASNQFVTSTSGFVLIVFKTDSSVVNQGWTLFYQSMWDPPTTGSSSDSNAGSGSNSKGIIIGAAIGGVVAASAAAFFAVFMVRRKRKSENGNDVEMSNGGKRSDGKGKESGGSANPFFTQLERKDFLPIGIPEIDDLFAKVQAPLDTLCDMSDSISAATEAIAGLDQQSQDVAQVAQAPFADKLKFILAEAVNTGCQIVPKVNGTEISLQVVGQGSSQILQAVDNITTLIKSAMDVVVKTPQIIQQLIELGQTAAEFPPKIKDMAASAGLSFMKIPKAVKNLSLNIEYLAAAPNDVKAFLESIQQLVQTLKEVFGIGGENPALPQEAPTLEATAMDTTQQVNNNTNVVDVLATNIALQIVQVAEPKKKICIKRMNKRGGAEMWLPNTMEELLNEGGQLLGINAVKVRNAETEYLISDISLIEANQTIFLTDANDEAQF